MSPCEIPFSGSSGRNTRHSENAPDSVKSPVRMADDSLRAWTTLPPTRFLANVARTPMFLPPVDCSTLCRFARVIGSRSHGLVVPLHFHQQGGSGAQPYAGDL